MPNEKSAGLPDHLAPLLEPTPSGVAKVVAAWDGLNTELQILILTELDKARLPLYLKEKIRVKALDSAIAYVRYLAARGLDFSRNGNEERKAIKQCIEEDPDPLVRYCLLERNMRGDPDAFFALPHEARLAKVRLFNGSGGAMAVLLSHAVDYQLKEGKVSEIELFEILSDYVNNAELKNYYREHQDISYDGWTDYYVSQEGDTLWRLVLKVPESFSHVLIENLPPHAGLSTGIPEDVLKSLTDSQLTILFNREDIGLKEDTFGGALRDLRKKVFFDAEKGLEVRGAAIHYNFDPDYAEFAAILAKPKSDRNEILDYLTFARNLSLCLYDAIHDVLLANDGGDPLDAEFARNALERRLEDLKGWQRDKQLRELRLYRLAKAAVPWRKGEKGYPPSGELEFLSQVTVEGDTWGISWRS